MIDRPSRFLKGDPDHHAERCVGIADRLSAHIGKFIVEAQENGFTREQAQFMAKWLSMVGHVHEYNTDSHDYCTSSQVDSEMVAEYVRNGGGKDARQE